MVSLWASSLRPRPQRRAPGSAPASSERASPEGEGSARHSRFRCIPTQFVEETDLGSLKQFCLDCSSCASQCTITVNGEPKDLHLVEPSLIFFSKIFPGTLRTALLIFIWLR